MTTSKECKFAPTDKLSEADLKEYLGGVKVTVAFYDPRQGVLIPLDKGSRWSYDLPTLKMKAGESLICTLKRIAESVRGLGVGFTFDEPKVVVTVDDGHVLHVLILARSTVTHRPRIVEVANNLPKFSGLTGSNRVAAHLPGAVGW